MHFTPLVLAGLLLFVPVSAQAQDNRLDLFSAEALTIYGDLRVAAVDGEPSWTDGSFGKLRFGGDPNDSTSDPRLQVKFGKTGIVWQPRFSWSLGGTMVVEAQGGPHVEAGLSQAYLTYKPLGSERFQFSARAGLMWPPVSLEHTGPEWAVKDTLTPSAINSWIGEEVKVVGAEASGSFQLGQSTLTATLGGFDINDTAGALVTFRGWGMHDRTALATRKLPLPPLNDFMTYSQPRYTHPLLDLEAGVFKKPGYYAKLALDLPSNVRLELFHYDNRGNPDLVNAALEWGWRTKFDNIGLVAQPALGWQLRAQALRGHTLMGDEIDGVPWIDTTFRAAYGMVTHQAGKDSLSARVDLFGTRNKGSAVLQDDNENGWALTLAAKRQLTLQLNCIFEFLHIESTREARARSGLAAQQTQNQLQMALRVRW